MFIKDTSFFCLLKLICITLKSMCKSVYTQLMSWNIFMDGQSSGFDTYVEG